MSMPSNRFAEVDQTAWSIRVLSNNALPVELPPVLTDDVVVPLAYVIDEPFGAVLHVLLWSDEEAGSEPRCDVEVLTRRDGEGWAYVGSGGGSWPSRRVVDLTDEELHGRSLLELGECSVGSSVGVASFVYGVVSSSTRGVEFTDVTGIGRQWPKMRSGAFIIPSRLIASRLRPWIRHGDSTVI